MLVGLAEADEILMSVLTSISIRDYRIDYLKDCECNKSVKDCNECNNTGKIVTGSLQNNRRGDKRALLSKMAKLKKVEGEDFRLELVTTYGDLGLATFLIEKELRKYYHLTGCSIINLYLGPSDGSNFRFKSAVTQPYKASRAVKPEILTQLREWLIHVKGATVITGYEADDALGIYQKECMSPQEQIVSSKTIAIHCDKDIFMIPGLHFNTMTNEIIEVNELGYLECYTITSGKTKRKVVKGVGLAFFYYQMLVGDATDTIPSIKKGYGPVKAYGVLRNCKDEREYLNIVRAEYATYHEDNYLDRMYEQADLVWICRNREEKGRDYLKRRIQELFNAVLTR